MVSLVGSSSSAAPAALSAAWVAGLTTGRYQTTLIVSLVTPWGEVAPPLSLPNLGMHGGANFVGILMRPVAGSQSGPTPATTCSAPAFVVPPPPPAGPPVAPPPAAAVVAPVLAPPAATVPPVAAASGAADV